VGMVKFGSSRDEGIYDHNGIDFFVHHMQISPSKAERMGGFVILRSNYAQ
jgi:hypothetical protein